MLALFTDNAPEKLVDSLYGLSKPDPEAVARREKAVARMKKTLADSLRCTKPIKRLRRPL
jgi:hypothetical protein